MAHEVILRGREAMEWLTQKGTKHTGPHHYHKPKRCPFVFCKKCGLVLLRNRATEAAARKLCEWYTD